MPITSRDSRGFRAGATTMEHAMAELRRFPRLQWLDLARSDQSHRWRLGQGVAAEDYFRQLPEFRDTLEEALVLINGEVLLRREAGETPDVEEFRRRFPDLADDIVLQFEIDRILETSTLDAPDADGGVVALELPGYQFFEKLGAGASGVVYKARQRSLGRFVAVKVVPLPGAEARQVARQRQEAEILARLQHPNVVHIYEVCEYRGALHLVMEYVGGATLAERIQGRPSTAADSSRMALTLADAVHAVHEAGVLHRDLKPSNILQTASGELKITDFGLAKLRSGGDLLTAPESVLGTPSYMAPEQAVGNADAIGPTADVYSLGAILYELLTGRPPFLGATVLDTLSLIRSSEPVSPRRLQPHLSRDLETICLKCLEKAPRQRYESAAALADDLRRFLAGDAIVARPPGALERLIRFVNRKRLASASAAACLTLAGVIAVMAWTAAAHEGRLSAEALVESIAVADPQALPRLLDKLPLQSEAMLPMVHQALAATAATDSKWVNLSIAALTVDPAEPEDALLRYLPTARPTEIAVIVPVLAARAQAVRRDVWRMLQDDATTDDARLYLACLAAQVSPVDSRWASVAPSVVRALVWQHPLDTSAFTAALAPARKTLVPSLVTLHRDPELEPVAREVAAGILARFAADQPRTLVDVIVEADPSEFRLVLPALQYQASAALPCLEAVAKRPAEFAQVAHDHASETRHTVERFYDQAERRQATAMIAMWRVGHRAVALEAMHGTQAPALRAWLIELLAPLGVSADAIWTEAKNASDGGVRQALLLALGQDDFQELASARHERLVADLLKIYRDDPDAGVHAACRWLLRTRLHAAATVAAIDETLSSQPSRQRGWYAGPNGHSFAAFRGPLTFIMGSPPAELSREADESAHKRTIDHGFAIGTEEVTIGQFKRFRERYFNTLYSATDDCPANNITWFDAAAYCRWLSEQEGVPEDQMCYPPVAEIVPGMRLPAHWIERTGYRLPTEAEWEYACRGGVSASRFCGEGKELLSRYAWFVNNSDDHAWPVGQLKPNAFGLFDMLGNVTERCQDAMEVYPAAATSRSVTATPGDATVEATALRAFRGANFGDAEHNLRSARRNVNGVLDEWALIGFRPVRTL